MSTQTRAQLAPTDLPDQRPWATYERISKRAGDGKGAHLNMDSQHAENLAYLHGIQPQADVVDFRDNASAWDEETHRPDWQRMLEGLAAGDFAGVVGWHADRYTRQPEQLEHLIKACRRGNAQLHTRLGGHQATPLMLRIQSDLAADESDQKSRRQILKRGQMAERGVYHGGRRSYGYTVGRTAQVPEEAAHIQWAAQQVLAGASIRSITAGLAERGSVTPSGQAWRAGNLARFLRQPALAGKRVHHGEIVGDGTWLAPPLLDLGTWTAVRTLLENPERRVAKRAPRVYLLSGIATCGSCGGPMRGRSNASSGKVAAYFCGAGKGCAYRRADLVDYQVTAELVDRLARMDASGAMAAPASDSELAAATIQKRRDDTQDELNGMARMALRKEISSATLAAAQADADAILAECDAQLGQLAVAQRQPVAVLKGLAGMANAGEIFHGMTLEERRAVVQQLCTVVIQPTPSNAERRAYDRELVRVTWRS